MQIYILKSLSQFFLNHLQKNKQLSFLIPRPLTWLPKKITWMQRYSLLLTAEELKEKARLETIEQ